jgi:hypothetical protein
MKSAVKRPIAPLFAFFLALLVATTQLEGAMHALTHVGDALGHTRDHSLLAGDGERCVECALLGSSANALSSADVCAPVTPASEQQPRSTPASFAPAFHSYYQSRAPPSLL